VDSWPVIERYPAGKQGLVDLGSFMKKKKKKLEKPMVASVSSNCGFFFLKSHQVFIRL
jgi:hypothetical protein